MAAVVHQSSYKLTADQNAAENVCTVGDLYRIPTEEGSIPRQKEEGVVTRANIRDRQHLFSGQRTSLFSKPPLQSFGKMSTHEADLALFFTDI